MYTRHTIIETTLGSLTLVAKDETITGLYFAHHIRRPATETFGPEVSPSEDGLLKEAGEQLVEYLAGARRSFDLPLVAEGNDFQKAVWAQLDEIPFGETTTYGRIAEKLGDRSLAYQVGQAVGANPLRIFVPCHRVLGANGALTGYAGGLKRKKALLDLEEPAQVRAGRLF